eukprot:GHVQ01037988.1.p1 GENE.GHVQ01037988.1~~GHVQ01037988.1.p1  ORF type:complete len:112 (+),score=10.48 GHVQ01037988.1:169-504(+)
MRLNNMGKRKIKTIKALSCLFMFSRTAYVAVVNGRNSMEWEWRRRICQGIYNSGSVVSGKFVTFGCRTCHVMSYVTSQYLLEEYCRAIVLLFNGEVDLRKFALVEFVGNSH